MPDQAAICGHHMVKPKPQETLNSQHHLAARSCQNQAACLAPSARTLCPSPDQAVCLAPSVWRPSIGMLIYWSKYRFIISQKWYDIILNVKWFLFIDKLETNRILMQSTSRQTKTSSKLITRSRLPCFKPLPSDLQHNKAVKAKVWP